MKGKVTEVLFVEREKTLFGEPPRLRPLVLLIIIIIIMLRKTMKR
jgi:hypothetical protein